MTDRLRAQRFKRFRAIADGPYPALTIRYGRRFVLQYPDHGLAWLLLGIALVELARYEEAEQAFVKAIDLFPEDQRSIALGHMGHLFKMSGDFEQAAHWYRLGIETTANDATYYIFLGGALARQGRLHDAEEAYRVATRCSEGCIDEAFLNLGLVLRARERFKEAAECFREALRLDPEYQAARWAVRDVLRCLKLEKS